jgi:predicted TIM-barrel fold metal-dependent hydrolase
VQGFSTTDRLLRDLDAAGVDRAVLLGWYWENPATCAEQNRFLAGCVRAHPDRLSAFATVHPAAGDGALEELRRAAADGLCGLGEMSPHAQGFRADDPTWQRLLALAGELKLPVNLHVTDPSGRPYPGRVATPREDFARWAREFPATRFVLAHWGGGPEWAAVLKGFPNVWFDTAASPLLYDLETTRHLLAGLPPERVLFGSDYPLILHPREVAGPDIVRFVRELRACGATDAVMGGNAERLLKRTGIL